MYPDPYVTELTERAATRIESTGHELLGGTSSKLSEWYQRLFGTPGMSAAFVSRRSHPLVHLPVWAARAAGQSHRTAEDADITYSSMCGYLFVRLVDDVMDADTSADERNLLPSLAFFHSQFETTYRNLFSADHPFWRIFESEWFGAANAAVTDATTQTIDSRFFRDVSGRKTRAALIPVAARLYLADEPTLIETWSDFLRAFGLWLQFHNDVFDALKDAMNGNLTWFLSEGARQTGPGRSPARWFWTGGLSWARDVFADLEAEARRAADRLSSDGVTAYMQWRYGDANRRLERLTRAVNVMSSLNRVGTAQGRADDA